MNKYDEGHPVLPVVHPPFVLADAIKHSKVFVSGDENLLATKLVSHCFPSFIFLFIAFIL